MSNNLSFEDVKNHVFSLFLFFKSFCEKHNLKYWLAYGTMLGAVRHNDFIPWDDDFDVFMPRKDYEEFIKLMHQGVDHYSILHFRTNKKYPYAIARLNDCRFCSEDSIYNKDYGLGIFIDIYPIDGIKNIDDTKRFIRLKRMVDYSLLKINNESFLKLRFSQKVLIIFIKIIPRRFFLKRLDNLAKNENMFDFKKCSVLCWDPYFIFESHWFQKTTLLKFRGIDIPVPAGFDQFLTYIYGEYLTLPPVEKRKPYHTSSVYEK